MPSGAGARARYRVASHCAPKPRSNAFMESLSGCAVPGLNRWRLIRAPIRHRRRSAFARLVLRGRFGSTVVEADRRPFLLPLQLLVASGLFGAVARGTLKAI